MLSWVKTQGWGGLGVPRPYSHTRQPTAVLAPNGLGGMQLGRSRFCLSHVR